MTTTQPSLTERHRQLVAFVFDEINQAEKDVRDARRKLEYAQEQYSECVQGLRELPHPDTVLGHDYAGLCELVEDYGIVVPDELLMDEDDIAAAALTADQQDGGARFEAAQNEGLDY